MILFPTQMQLTGSGKDNTMGLCCKESPEWVAHMMLMTLWPLINVGNLSGNWVHQRRNVILYLTLDAQAQGLPKLQYWSCTLCDSCKLVWSCALTCSQHVVYMCNLLLPWPHVENQTAVLFWLTQNCNFLHCYWHETARFEFDLSQMTCDLLQVTNWVAYK